MAKSSKQLEQTWTERAVDQLKGRTIVSVRYMTSQEANALGWWSRPLMVELDDGTLIYAAIDGEGNGPGTLFGIGPEADNLMFPALP